MRQAMRWGVGVLVAVPLCLGAVGEKAAASRPVPAVEGINGKPAPQGEEPVFRLSRASTPDAGSPSLASWSTPGTPPLQPCGTLAAPPEAVAGAGVRLRR